MEYQDSEKKADQLKLTVDNWDLSNFDNPVWRAGNKVTITWGYPGRMSPVRECVIQKVTAVRVSGVGVNDFDLNYKLVRLSKDVHGAHLFDEFET